MKVKKLIDVFASIQTPIDDSDDLVEWFDLEWF
jgi:hypothetical protein